MSFSTTTTTTHCNHQIYSLWPASGLESPPSSPDDLVPIELHFKEIIGSSSWHQIQHNVTKKTTSIPLRDIIREEHRSTHLAAILSDLGVPEQSHSDIIADTWRLVTSVVADSDTTPPMIVVHASAFTWLLQPDDDPAFPDSIGDLGLISC